MKAIRLVAIAAAVGVAGALWWVLRDRPVPPEGQTLAIQVPELSALQSRGEAAFGTYCSACHGDKGAGTDQGPPLIHKIYEPSHHADFAFVRAVRQGVRSHHWRFGDMPPVEGISDDDLVAVIAYVRAVQRVNGIE